MLSLVPATLAPHSKWLPEEADWLRAWLFERARMVVWMSVNSGDSVHVYSCAPQEWDRWGNRQMRRKSLLDNNILCSMRQNFIRLDSKMVQLV